MKVLIAFLLLPASVAIAQDTQIAASLVLREQSRLGYGATYGAKIEGNYKLHDNWTVVAYATGLRSPKVDSGTGKSGFLSAGMRWAPLHILNDNTGKCVAEIFGEFDAILGALITDPYRKTVFHFRNAVGVKLLDGRLIIDVARLYQDILPDAAKLLKEGDRAALHTTFNQLSAWELEGYVWQPMPAKESRWGIKLGARYDRSRFVKNQLGERGRGWLLQFEVGPYRRL